MLLNCESRWTANSKDRVQIKKFPELAKLRTQARGLGLLQGKAMAQVSSEALHLWIEHTYIKETRVN